jgi:hypothetical protein
MRRKNLFLWPSIRHFDISTTFYISTIISSIHGLEIKDTKECSTSALYLDVLLKLDTNGKITTQLYDKRDDFNLSIVNFPKASLTSRRSWYYEWFACENGPSSTMHAGGKYFFGGRKQDAEHAA